jgi:lipoic acid synthetase
MVRKPNWLKTKIPDPKYILNMKKNLKGLNTVCESALCPNISECFKNKTATFMILGDVCTRSCGFCAVKGGVLSAPDPEEPYKVAEAVERLGIRYAVITSVTRDDLPDGGAEHFKRTVESIRKKNRDTLIEVLIPDFKGSKEALSKVIGAKPDVIAHNLETVPRLYPVVRPKADYNGSLTLLENVKKYDILTKSGIMLGLGEELEEVLRVMEDLKKVGCDILTIGQYLKPLGDKLEVKRFVHPDEFAELKNIGESLGFRHVESGPLVRSSYMAEKQYEEI